MFNLQGKNSFSVILFKAIENTRLLKTYTKIDSRVSELGYMIKHLAKVRTKIIILIRKIFEYFSYVI